MDEPWPDPNVVYQFAGSVGGAQTRWQKAVDEALEEKTLELHPVSDDVYNLQGSCPRCSHPMASSLEFTLVLPRGGFARGRPLRQRQSAGTRAVTTWIRDASDLAVTQGTFDVVCDCRSVHDGRSEEKKGCGWGAGVGVIIRKPQPAGE